MPFVPLLTHISEQFLKDKHFPEQLLVPWFPPTAAESLTAWEIIMCCSKLEAETEGLWRQDCSWAVGDTLLPWKIVPSNILWMLLSNFSHTNYYCNNPPSHITLKQIQLAPPTSFPLCSQKDLIFNQNPKGYFKTGQQCSQQNNCFSAKYHRYIN